MTVLSDAARRVSYAGNGTATAFAVPFPVLAATDLLVVRIAADGTPTALTLTADYTVTGLGNAGATVTMTVAPASGTTLRIIGRTAKVQPTDYQDQGGFPAAAHESAMDRFAMLAREAADDLAMALRGPLIEGGAIAELPGLIARAGRALGFDAAGNPVVGAPMASLDQLLGLLTATRPLSLPQLTVAATVAAMAALPKSSLTDGVAVLCLGQAARGDGSGGAFWWNATSTATANGTSIVAAAEGGTGRWLRAPLLGGSTFSDLTVTGLLTTLNLTVTNDVSIGDDLAVTGDASIGATLAAGRTTITGGAHTVAPNPAAAAASLTLDCATTNVFRISMGANIGTLFLNNAGFGQTIAVRFKQDGTGGRTVTWPTNFRWPGGSAPLLSTGANKIDLLTATYMDEGTPVWLASLQKDFS